MRALIFAAGLGTRLKPITDTLPKALVPVCSQPLLKHLITKLSGAGFTDIVINVHHFADKIREYVAQNRNFGLNISFSDETDLLRETGGGIKHAAPLFPGQEPFLVHNVDILSNLDLEEFYEAHMASSISADTPLATLLVSSRKTARYLLFDNENNLVGWMNVLSGEVKSPYSELVRSASENFDAEKFLQENKLKKYAFAGTHVISPEIFNIMQGCGEKFPIIDFYLQIADKYIIKGFVKEDLKMVDVGKLDTIKEAEDFLNERE